MAVPHRVAMDVERPDHGHVAGDAPPRVTRRPLGVQLFASAQDEPRSRRPTDVVLAIISAVMVVLAGLAFNLLTELEQAISGAVSSVPGFFDIVWKLLFRVPVAWSLLILVVAAARGRLALVRDLIGAIVLSVAGAAAVAAIMTSDGPGFADVLFDVGGPPVFPPALVAVATAVLSTASPHLSRPFRTFGHWLIGLQLIGAVMLGAAVPSAAVAAVAVGLLAAALIHLAVGSPGGRPTVSRIRLALADLGLRVDDLAPAAMQAEGVVLFEGTDVGGPLLVKVYGRDAGDAQLLASLWRRLWYRGVDPTVRQTRVELVEHEGFITLLGERAGIEVPRVVSAGSAGRGDALVVVRPIGETIGRCWPPRTRRATSTRRRCRDSGVTSTASTTAGSSTAESISTA
jgi:hypothetical protein